GSVRPSIRAGRLRAAGRAGPVAAGRPRTAPPDEYGRARAGRGAFLAGGAVAGVAGAVPPALRRYAMTLSAAQPLARADQADAILRELESAGAVALPRLVSDEALSDMQRAFASRLNGLRWNDCDGYERTEVSRFMVPDVLTLAQGFVDLGLHPLVKAVLDRYLGEGRYELCEAKGWKSLPTKKDLHGWHGDAWYDQ